ncbi:MAG: UUP1 family membrane protein, partial [Pseudomonadota bacterium]
MVSKAPFFVAVIILIIIGIAMSITRHETYGVPWIPGETRQIWDIEARIEFTARGGEVKASLAAPKTQSGFTLINESASSPGYGVSYVENGNQRRVEWTIREAEGSQTIYYRTQFLVDDNAKGDSTPPNRSLEQPTLPGPEVA